MQTKLRIINQSEIFTLLARVSHGDIGIAGFPLLIQQGNAAIKLNVAPGNRGIYFYDSFAHNVAGNIDLSLQDAVPFSLTVTGSAGALSFAISNASF